MDDETKWAAELDTLKAILRSRNRGIEERDLMQLATGVLLLATLQTDAHLVDGLAMLRHDMERRGLATYATMSVSTVGEIDIVTGEDRRGDPEIESVTGAVLKGTHEQVRRLGGAIYREVTVELPRATS